MMNIRVTILQTAPSHRSNGQTLVTNLNTVESYGVSALRHVLSGSRKYPPLLVRHRQYHPSTRSYEASQGTYSTQARLVNGSEKCRVNVRTGQRCSTASTRVLSRSSRLYYGPHLIHMSHLPTQNISSDSACVCALPLCCWPMALFLCSSVFS